MIIDAMSLLYVYYSLLQVAQHHFNPFEVYTGCWRDMAEPAAPKVLCHVHMPMHPNYAVEPHSPKNVPKRVQDLEKMSKNEKNETQK